ncbi:hypothetical protein [Parapedomonas caeni]
MPHPHAAPFLLALILAVTPAAASPARALFEDGRFSEAATAARDEGTPDALALAARATLAVAAFEAPTKARAEALIRTAIADAERALQQEPRQHEAQLQRAIAKGYLAKLGNSPKLGREARRLMDQALRQAPDNALAWAALGGWHGESVATLGGFLAGSLLGARESEGIRHYEEALRRDPASPTFPTFFAFTLARLDDDNWPRVRTLLERAGKLPPRDGFEALMAAQARDVLAALNARETKRAKVLILRYQPFGQFLAGKAP